MGKNIVLCADGTGKQGAVEHETNVFKIYQAAIINSGKKVQQVVYYDRGVGTSNSKFFKLLGTFFGLGFKRQVRELYEFLGRNYQEGDNIYVFGFSRGAATVRAFAGMIEHCGLVTQYTDELDANGNKDKLSDEEFQKKIKAAMKFYKNRNADEESKLELPFETNRDVKIKFLGVWDTVAALGLKVQFPRFDKLINRFQRHQFYDYEPKTCVKNVYHAISIDDERRPFWPLVWNENEFQGETIEQVWFPGVHSNIGGGYPREGLANVTLDWMIEKLGNHNLNLKDEYLEKAQREKTPHGKLYDTRSSWAIYYRYHPRPIQDLCVNKMKNSAPIKIHESVIDRMELRTQDYAPGNLPDKFELIGPGKDPILSMDMAGNHDFIKTRKKVEANMKKRRILYEIYLLVSILLITSSLFLWKYPPLEWGNDKLGRAYSEINSFLGHVADILRYVLPDIFEGAITYGVIQNPMWFLGVTIISFMMICLRIFFKGRMEEAQEDMRLSVLEKMGRL